MSPKIEFIGLLNIFTTMITIFVTFNYTSKLRLTVIINFIYFISRHNRSNSFFLKTILNFFHQLLYILFFLIRIEQKRYWLNLWNLFVYFATRYVRAFFSIFIWWIKFLQFFFVNLKFLNVCFTFLFDVFILFLRIF